MALLQPPLFKPIFPEDQDPVFNHYLGIITGHAALMNDLGTEPNHGLLQLAAILQQAGARTDVFDFHVLDIVLRQKRRIISEDDFRAVIAKKSARLYGISSKIVSASRAMLIARLIKELHPDSKVVMGGVHPTFQAAQILKQCPAVDAVMRGESDHAIVPLWRWATGDGELSDIPGVTFRAASGAIVSSQKDLTQIELDELPYAAYELVARETDPLVPRILTARGCTLRCVFCASAALFGYKFNSRQAEAFGAITDVGQIKVCSVRSNAIKVERTPRLARDEHPPSIFLGVQIAGSSLIVQGDREAVLRPGDLAFSDSTTPYSLLDSGGIRQHFFCIPMAALALPYGAIRQLAAVTLSPGHPVADLAATYFRRLASRPDIFKEPGVAAVGRPSIELVRALLTTHLDASALAKESLEATLLLRILEYARAHLPEPELNAAQIATVHHISVRHLYNVLARGGISLGDWIRARRLEECRDELSRPQSRAETISSVARRRGSPIRPVPVVSSGPPTGSRRTNGAK